MSVLKNKNVQVSNFEFGELVPSSKKSNPVNPISNFEMKSLNASKGFKSTISAETIRSEREFESKTSFEILSIVKDHRGLNKQAADDYEERVSAEVALRIEALREEAYKEGYEKGLAIGEEKAFTEGQAFMDTKIAELAEEVSHVQQNMNDVYHKSKQDAYMMVKNLTKWVILKEVDEKYYLSRLLEKLIHEINLKSNLVIHVNEEAFGYMPEIVKIVERRLGSLTNTRIEVDYGMQGNGIKLESENTIIDGSLESQFETIDKLFQNVGLNE